MKYAYSLLVLLLIVLCSSAAPSINDQGEKIYLDNCKRCHGTDGRRGFFGAPDLSISAMPLDERIALIKKGKGMMKPYSKKLTDEEIKDVAEYSLQLVKQ